MGDTLMILPSLVQLYGKSLCTFVGRRPGLDFIKEFVHHSLDIEAAGWHRLFMKSPDDQSLPVNRTDLVVAFFTKQAADISKNLKAYFPHVPIHVFPSASPEDTGLHISHYLGECLKSAGLPVDPAQSIKNAASRPLFRGAPQTIPRRRIIFHPGSGDSRKNYPPDLWLKLFEKYGHKNTYPGMEETILLGPAEERLVDFFRKNPPPRRMEIALRPGKEDLMQLLREAALYVGHDSGITHLAAMMGTPTIALFRISDANQWRPLGPRVRIIDGKETGLRLIERTLDLSGALMAERTHGMAKL